ncbi:MAG: hypothetical protein U5K69_04725 [Balneolaceae bacterium]|nr:hypothetical protein [Balneolaceae bacterium]
MSGREGDYVTSNQLKDRLMRELRTNVSIKVEQTDNADVLQGFWSWRVAAGHPYRNYAA